MDCASSVRGRSRSARTTRHFTNLRIADASFEHQPPEREKSRTSADRLHAIAVEEYAGDPWNVNKLNDQFQPDPWRCGALESHRVGLLRQLYFEQFTRAFLRHRRPVTPRADLVCASHRGRLKRASSRATRQFLRGHLTASAGCFYWRPSKGCFMTKRSLQQLLKLSALTSATLLALSAHATLQSRTDDRQDQTAQRPDKDDDDDDDRGGRKGLVPLPTGQFVTPTIIEDAVQQYLNPALPGYPNFVAGEAVRSQLSPDGSTLAILTAGQNSLYRADGTVDVANSTQYVFLYNVEGANKANPLLTQVIKQPNSHVGLVFSPNGNTLYAAGGNDDAVYVYTKSGSGFVTAAPIALGHFAPGATGAARNKGVGLGVQPNASGLGISSDGATLVVANNYNDSISVIDTATRTVRYEHDLRQYFANNEGRSGGVGGTFPYAVVIKGNDTAYVSSDRDREVVVVSLGPTQGRLIKRIKLDGNGLGMTLDASQATLYVAQDNEIGRAHV